MYKKNNPSLPESVQEAINTYCSQADSKHLFSPHPRVTALLNITDWSVESVFKAYSSTGFTFDAQEEDYPIFFAVIRHLQIEHNIEHDPIDTINALCNLHSAGILNQANFDTIIKHEKPYNFITEYPSDTLGALCTLNKAGILNQASFEVIIKLQKPQKSFDLPKTLISLHDLNILTQENFDDIIRHPDPTGFAYALLRLHETAIFTQKKLDAIREHPDPCLLIEGIFELCEKNIINDENVNTIKMFKDPHSLALVLCELHEAGILNEKNLNAIRKRQDCHGLWQGIYGVAVHVRTLTQAIFDAIIAHKDPESVATATSVLDKQGILTPENLNAIIAHQDCNSLAATLFPLPNGAIPNTLSQNNFDTIIRHPKPQRLALATGILRMRYILTKENFDATIAHQDCNSLADAFYALYTAGILNNEAFERIITHPKPQSLAEALFILLKEKKIVCDQQYDAMMEHKEPLNIALAICILYAKKILTSENFDTIITHPKPQSLAEALCTLNNKRYILTQENFDTVTRHRAPAALATILVINNKDVFQQEDLEPLIKALIDVIDWGQIEFIADFSGFFKDLKKFTFAKVESLLNHYVNKTEANTPIPTKEAIIYAMLLINHLQRDATVKPNPEKAEDDIVEPNPEGALEILENAEKKEQDPILQTIIHKLMVEIRILYGINGNTPQDLVTFFPTMNKNRFFALPPQLPDYVQDHTPTDPYHPWAILPYSPRQN